MDEAIAGCTGAVDRLESLAQQTELDKKQAQALLRKKVVGIAYETIQTSDGSLPCLQPMSEIAGRLSVQEGAKYLEKPHGGRGVLLGGVPGVARGQVTVLGGGVVGLTGLGGADADGDGASDWAEWMAGTAATNPASRLMLVTLPAATPAAAKMILSWASADGRRYRIQASTNVSPSAFVDVVTNVPATPPLNVRTVDVQQARTFFRIQVEP